MQQIQVDLGVRSYPIFIGQNLFAETALLAKFLRKKHILIVTNDTIAPLYLDAVASVLGKLGPLHSVILPDGEQYKSLQYLNDIFTQALELNYSRDCMLVALGGGVIGDMTGFAAACYQRGVDFIQIPTTLLSQVDSSVGGKTAVNHALGKNMIGAFHQPKAVFIDTLFLNTLPAREFYAGMAEVIKYGIIWDGDFFNWLEQNISLLTLLDANALIYAIKRCCEIKAEVVKQDETEHGVRALLNLGHTFGHAIEAEMGYGNWLHGEAISVGMVLASKMAVAMGLIDNIALNRITNLLVAFNLPIVSPNQMNVENYLEHMQRDKKVLSGKLRFILPQAIGKADIYGNIDHALLKQVILS